MRYKCIIIEDEQQEVEVIQNYLQNVPAIEVAAVCSNAGLAMDALKKMNIDLIFHDLKIPLKKGNDFVKALSNPPKVIIITEYKDNIENNELELIDYLLKPVSFERFIKAIDRFYVSMHKPSLLHEETNPGGSKQGKYIFVKSDRKFMKIILDDIYFIESMKDYVIIHLPNRKVITKQRISYYEQTLPHDLFVRIHKSYIVSVNKIDAISPASVEVCGKDLPIGRNYKIGAFAKFKLIH